MKGKSAKKKAGKSKKKKAKRKKPPPKVSPINLSVGDMFVSKYKDALDDLVFFKFVGVEEDLFTFFSADRNLSMDTPYAVSKKIKFKNKILKNENDEYFIAIYLNFNDIGTVLKKIEYGEVVEDPDEDEDDFINI